MSARVALAVGAEFLVVVLVLGCTTGVAPGLLPSATPDPSALNAAVERAVASALAARVTPSFTPTPSGVVTPNPTPAIADLLLSAAPTTSAATAPPAEPAPPRSTPAPVVTLAPSPPSQSARVAVSPAAISAGGTIEVSWEIASPNRDDWFGFFPEGMPSDVLPLRQVTGGIGSGSKVVNLPVSVDAGTYQVRLFAHTGLNVDVEIARSGRFTLIPGTVPTVTVSPAQVHFDEPYTIRYTGFPLGSQVRLSSGDQGDIAPPFVLTSDPYTTQLVVRSGQVNVTQSKSPVQYTIASTVSGKSYPVTVMLIP